MKKDVNNRGKGAVTFMDVTKGPIYSRSGVNLDNLKGSLFGHDDVPLQSFTVLDDSYPVIYTTDITTMGGQPIRLTNEEASLYDVNLRQLNANMLNTGSTGGTASSFKSLSKVNKSLYIKRMQGIMDKAYEAYGPIRFANALTAVGTMHDNYIDGDSTILKDLENDILGMGEKNDNRRKESKMFENTPTMINGELAKDNEGTSFVLWREIAADLIVDVKTGSKRVKTATELIEDNIYKYLLQQEKNKDVAGKTANQ
jgi:hypothetical protein